MMSSQKDVFWQTKTLEEMSRQEWEQLCDGCGLCCLVRVEDEDSGEIYETNVICAHYDCERKGCSSYQQRQTFVDGCSELTHQQVGEFDWLPDSCAYRLVYKGQALPKTHPLISNSQETTQTVVELFEPIGLFVNSPDIDPEQHLILKDETF